MRLTVPKAVALGVYQHHPAYRTLIKFYPPKELVRLSEKNGAIRPDREGNSNTKKEPHWAPLLPNDLGPNCWSHFKALVIAVLSS